MLRLVLFDEPRECLETRLGTLPHGTTRKTRVGDGPVPPTEGVRAADEPYWRKHFCGVGRVACRSSEHYTEQRVADTISPWQA